MYGHSTSLEGFSLIYQCNEYITSIKNKIIRFSPIYQCNEVLLLHVSKIKLLDIVRLILYKKLLFSECWIGNNYLDFLCHL